MQQAILFPAPLAHVSLFTRNESDPLSPRARRGTQRVPWVAGAEATPCPSGGPSCTVAFATRRDDAKGSVRQWTLQDGRLGPRGRHP